MFNSRSTAVDLLSPRGVRDNRRQHIQHQLDSLRFYDSVPLYDGLRRLTPAATASSSTAPDQVTSRGDSPWPPAPPPQRGHTSTKRLRRVASEPTDCGHGQQKQARGIWSLAGSGRPSAAPRWPTSAETVGGLRPRHWPPVNDRGPYWIRLESALTMTKPEDEQQNAVDDEGGAFEYRVDVPVSEQRRTSSSSVNEHHHSKASSHQQEMYLSNGHQCPSAGHHCPKADQLQTSNSHQYPNNGHLYPTDREQRMDGQQQYPCTEQSCFNTGHRYPRTAQHCPVTTQRGTAASDQRPDGNDGDYNDEDVTRRTCENGDCRNTSRQQTCDRRHRQRHRDAPADVIVTSPTVDPPRYELFTHV